VARIGLLAYGSLRWDPEDPLSAELKLSDTASVVRTPFWVEFARKSRVRGGGPTLVPVERGGARVEAELFPFRDGLSIETAKTLLWRRETGRHDGKYVEPDSSSVPINKVVIDQLAESFLGFDKVFAARVWRNLDDLNPEKLAELAIESAGAEAGKLRRDGISYLIKAKEYGIETPLRPAYEAAILQQLEVVSLEEAWKAASHRL
jgi:hypothetical protein